MHQSYRHQSSSSNIFKNRRLIISLSIRDIESKYRGSILGLFWLIFNPILMLLVYTFVFSVVFQAKWGGGSGDKIEFALILFIGLIVYNLFSENVARSPTSIISNVNYVKKVMFPLEVIAIVNMISSLFNCAISVIILLVAYTIFYGVPHLSSGLVPFVLLPVVLWGLGIGWFLSALGVYLRDVSQVVGVFLTALMFLSPIFYPVSALPDFYQQLVQLNPLSNVIEQMRDVLFWGRGVNLFDLLLNVVVSLVVAKIGFVFFQKARKGFADVL